MSLPNALLLLLILLMAIGQGVSVYCLRTPSIVHFSFTNLMHERQRSHRNVYWLLNFQIPPSFCLTLYHDGNLHTGGVYQKKLPSSREPWKNTLLFIAVFLFLCHNYYEERDCTERGENIPICLIRSSDGVTNKIRAAGRMRQLTISLSSAFLFYHPSTALHGSAEFLTSTECSTSLHNR